MAKAVLVTSDDPSSKLESILEKKGAYDVIELVWEGAGATIDKAVEDSLLTIRSANDRLHVLHFSRLLYQLRTYSHGPLIRCPAYMVWCP